MNIRRNALTAVQSMIVLELNLALDRITGAH
jgi:hypothetical protein